MKNKLEILYEDNHIIVVVKPYNILSQSDSTKDIDMQTIIKNYIKEKYNKKGNVYLALLHRLDRPTGGIMIFAKTSKAAKRLSEDFKNNKIKKTYLAVIENFPLEKGTFTDHIEKQKEKSVISKKGKFASLTFEKIKQIKNYSLVKINLQTGRHHQIRVQFSERGFPLYGDQKYGKQDKKQLLLYAYKLEFTHPVTKEKMTFTKIPTYSKFSLFKEYLWKIKK